MQAIRTRYLGSTDTKPARMSAECEEKRIVISYEDGNSLDKNHACACRALVHAIGWNPAHQMVSGVFDHDFYWVFKD